MSYEPSEQTPGLSDNAGESTQKPVHSELSTNGRNQSNISVMINEYQIANDCGRSGLKQCGLMNIAMPTLMRDIMAWDHGVEAVYQTQRDKLY